MTAKPDIATLLAAGTNRTEAYIRDTVLAPIVAWAAQMPGGAARSELTIASGSVTPTGAVHTVDTESDAGTDDLTHLDQTNLPDGAVVVLMAADAGRVPTAKHGSGGTGQILLATGADWELTGGTTGRVLVLTRVGTSWEEIGRWWGGDAAGLRSWIGAAALAAANTFSAVNTFSAQVRLAVGTAIDDDDVDGSNILTLPTDGNVFSFSGTQQVDTIATLGIGTEIEIHCASARQWTHHATDLILPGGANITSAAGDVIRLREYATGDWRCTSYVKADGRSPVTGWTGQSSTATTSGTTVTKSGIDAGPSQVVIFLNGISDDTGSQELLLQVGNSGGLITSGYTCRCVEQLAASWNQDTATAGFQLANSGGWNPASQTLRGTIVLSRLNGNQWSIESRLIRADGAVIWETEGYVTCADLDRVALTTVAGTATFDAGSAQIAWRH